MENQNIRNEENKIQNLVTAVAIAIILSCLLLLSSCATWSKAPYYDDKGHGRSYSGSYYDDVKLYDKSFHRGWRTPGLRIKLPTIPEIRKSRGLSRSS